MDEITNKLLAEFKRLNMVKRDNAPRRQRAFTLDKATFTSKSKIVYGYIDYINNRNEDLYKKTNPHTALQNIIRLYLIIDAYPTQLSGNDITSKMIAMLHEFSSQYDESKSRNYHIWAFNIVLRKLLRMENAGKLIISDVDESGNKLPKDDWLRLI